ncbi:MAG: hypothetical protein APR54_03610 [Candidatus Cloacimonas sp. SDB]|nr:MAG: hypothetical protein APR54_03610 [Candidatus Cloacimonas sp. SDB]
MNLIDKFRKYMSDVLSLEVNITMSQARTKNDLPFAIVDNYKFYDVTILDNPYLAIAPIDGDNLTPSVYRKQIDVITNSINREVILLVPVLDSFNRKRLIKYKVPFIVPGNQMYLPNLMIDLREHFRKLKTKKEHYSPAAQSLLLYMLNRNSFGPFDVDTLSEISGYSKPTIRRCLKEFDNSDLGSITTDNKNKIFNIKNDKISIWEKSKELLKSPVNKTVWLGHNPPGEAFPEAGLSALSRNSMIASPKNATYAIWKNEWKVLRQDQKFRNLLEPDRTETNVCLQIWSYSPTLWRPAYEVDKFSLYLSLINGADERIEDALEEILSGELRG